METISNIPLCFTFYLLFIFYFSSLLSMMQANNKRGQAAFFYVLSTKGKKGDRPFFLYFAHELKLSVFAQKK